MVKRAPRTPIPPRTQLTRHQRPILPLGSHLDGGKNTASQPPAKDEGQDAGDSYPLKTDGNADGSKDVNHETTRSQTDTTAPSKPDTDTTTPPEPDNLPTGSLATADKAHRIGRLLCHCAGGCKLHPYMIMSLMQMRRPRKESHLFCFTFIT